jgi:hypothetical protein
MQQSKQRPISVDLLRQLIGEWSVGIAMKVSEDKVVSGCGEMSQVAGNFGVYQEMDEDVTAKWIDKDQFELKGLNYDTGKKLHTD